MDALTTADVLAAIESWFDAEDQSWWELRDCFDRHEAITLPDLPDPLYVVDSYGGSGMGEQMWVILEYAGRFFRKSGFFASWDGSNWDGPFQEVRSERKMVTVYQEVGDAVR